MPSSAGIPPFRRFDRKPFMDSTPSGESNASTRSSFSTPNTLQQPPLWLRFVQDLLQQPIYLLGLQSILLLLAFGSDIDIVRTGEKDATQLSSQAAFKLLVLLCSGGLGAWGWWTQPNVRQLLKSFPGIFLTALGVWYLLSFPFSMFPKLSLASAVTYWSLLLFAASALVHLGGTRCMMLYLIGNGAFLIGSVLLYFVQRDLTIMIEVMSLTNKVERFGGLGHPNTLGRITATTALLLIGLVRMKKIPWPWLMAALPCMLAISIASKSRSPVLAGILALAPLSFPYLQRPSIRLAAIMAGIPTLAMIVLLFLSVDPDAWMGKILAKFTKTGDMKEITTVTGRTEIWAFAWEKACESPLFGKGAGSTPVLMEKHSGYAHNILLQPAVSLGFPAALFLLILLCWNLYWIFRFPVPPVQMVTLFILIIGITEAVMFSPLPEGITSLWMVCCLWPVWQAIDPQREQHDAHRHSPTWLPAG